MQSGVVTCNQLQPVGTGGAQPPEGQSSTIKAHLSEAGLTDEAKGVEVSGHGARCPPLALAKPEIQTAKPIRYLRGDGVLLAQAVRQLGLAHLVAQGYCPLQAPCFLQPRALEARVWTHPPGRRMTPNA